MNQKKIIKEYDGIGRIDSCNLPDVEVRFCQYSDGEIKGEVKNKNDRHVAEFWNSLKDFTPLTIEGNTSSGDSFVFHSFFAVHPTTELVGKDFEVVRTGVVEDNREYDFKIEFGLLQLTLYQIQQIRCDSPFGEFTISPVQNSSEILEEIKASKIYAVTSHISFIFSSRKENLEKNISEIVDYLESVMILLSFAQGVFINNIYYNLYIKDTEGFKLYKSVHCSAKTKGSTSDELIGTLHIQNFLVSVLPTFTEKDFQTKTGVGDAIEWYLESIRPSVMENKFIQSCIAIELLNDRFKKNKSKNRGKILTDEQFKKLNTEVKRWISQNISDKSKRAEIYPKIRELNRPTLKNSLKDMYHFYVIGYLDLFQDFEFVEIRDNIVHTGLLKDDSKDPHENYIKLVALLQRTLLGMLNYTGEFIDQSDNWKHKKFKKENGLKTKTKLKLQKISQGKNGTR